jgi:hypothetical protein
MNYIPVADTLDLVFNITTDSVEALQLSIATREELLQHLYNLAYVVTVHSSPNGDTTRLQAIINAQHAHPIRESTT